MLKTSNAILFAVRGLAKVPPQFTLRNSTAMDGLGRPLLQNSMRRAMGALLLPREPKVNVVLHFPDSEEELSYIGLRVDRSRPSMQRALLIVAIACVIMGLLTFGRIEFHPDLSDFLIAGLWALLALVSVGVAASLRSQWLIRHWQASLTLYTLFIDAIMLLCCAYPRSFPAALTRAAQIRCCGRAGTGISSRPGHSMLASSVVPGPR